MITASSDKTCKLWAVDSGECLQTLEGHTDEIFSCAFNYEGAHALFPGTWPELRGARPLGRG